VRIDFGTGKGTLLGIEKSTITLVLLFQSIPLWSALFRVFSPRNIGRLKKLQRSVSRARRKGCPA